MWLFHFVSLVSICNHAKARFSGLVTEGGQNKPQIWNPRPQFAYSLYNFYKATMTIKGTLLLNNSIVKRSVEKTNGNVNENIANAPPTVDWRHIT